MIDFFALRMVVVRSTEQKTDGALRWPMDICGLPSITRIRCCWVGLFSENYYPIAANVRLIFILFLASFLFARTLKYNRLLMCLAHVALALGRWIMSNERPQA